MKTLAIKICARTLTVATLAVAHATFAQDGDIRTGEANGLTWTYQVTSEDFKTASLCQNGITPTIPHTTKDQVVIPAELNGYIITEIGKCAFMKCNFVSGFDIPNTIVAIQENAFSACRRLKTIIIPESDTTFGEEVFSSDSNLTTIYVVGNTSQANVLAALTSSNINSCSVKTLATFDSGCESFMTKLTPPSTPGGKWQITAFASVADGTADGLTAANVHVLYGHEPTVLATDAAARLTTATNAVMVRLEFDAPDDDVRYYKVKFGY